MTEQTSVKTPLTLYGIPGLGADQRVFEYLQLNCNFVPLNWITPKQDESLLHYAQRLSDQIDTTRPFGLLGLSFGGLIAIELAKVLEPQITFLISSAETRDELPLLYRGLGKTSIASWIPSKLFIPPRFLARYFFGTKNGQLLNSILNDTDPAFTKWAVNGLLNWKNTTRVNNLVRIHGTADKLIPWKGEKTPEAHLIEKGTHFMVVDRAKEVSTLINQCI